MAVAKKAEGTASQNKSGGLRKRIGFFREVWNELKKVHWPTRNQLLTYTGVVFVSVSIVAFLIWIVDSSLSYVMTLMLNQ